MYAELAGYRIHDAKVVVPELGPWCAEALVEGEQTLSGAVVLSVASLTLTGTVLRSLPFGGTTRVRLVAGAGGWGKQVPAKWYVHDAGLRVSTIAKDAAKAVGEAVSVSDDTTLARAFVREAGPASRVLAQLGRPWFVGADGVTVIGSRPTGTVSSPFAVIAFDGAAGKALVAAEALEDWVPGRAFASPTLSKQNIAAVVHRLDRGTLRTEVFAR